MLKSRPKQETERKSVKQEEKRKREVRAGRGSFIFLLAGAHFASCSSLPLFNV